MASFKKHSAAVFTVNYLATMLFPSKALADLAANGAANDNVVFRHGREKFFITNLIREVLQKASLDVNRENLSALAKEIISAANGKVRSSGGMGSLELKPFLEDLLQATLEQELKSQTSFRL